MARKMHRRPTLEIPSAERKLKGFSFQERKGVRLIHFCYAELFKRSVIIGQKYPGVF
jgi:hypothetical protein